MAVIIPLFSRERRVRDEARKPVDPAKGAEILLFMGVRYERHDGPAPQSSKTARPARTKKRA